MDERTDPLRRWGTCEEAASLAEYMCAKENGYMTGTIVACDGGWTAK